MLLSVLCSIRKTLLAPLHAVSAPSFCAPDSVSLDFGCASSQFLLSSCQVEELDLGHHRSRQHDCTLHTGAQIGLKNDKELNEYKYGNYIYI